MAVNVPPTAVGSNDGLGPVGKKMTTEELIRTDGKAGAFLWWGEVPNGAFLFTEQQVQKLLAAERERCATELEDMAENWPDVGAALRAASNALRA